MMNFEEYRRLDAVAMAGLVQKGEVSAAELLECAYARYKQVNPALNAIINPMFANARRHLEKTAPQGLLAGVPIVLKDLLGHFPGVPTSAGSRSAQRIMQTVPSTLVKRLCDQGAIVIGKTNTPEFGLLATTENSTFGATSNPWNVERTAGGSSGGTASAVAAGIVPVGTAGDGGGSIRIPASCCGLFGLKPSRGLVPSGPEFGEVWDGAVCEHLITRSVRDSARSLDLIAGPDPQSHCRVATSDSFEKNLQQPPGRLRIAFSSESPLGGQSSASCREAVLQAANLLESLGHQVTEARPVLDADDIVQSYTDIYIAHVTAEINQLVRRHGRRHARQNVESLPYLISRLGQRFSAGDYVLSRQRWVRLRTAMAQFHEQHDLWLTPTMAESPCKLGELHSSTSEQWLAAFAGWSGIHRLLPVSILYQFSRPLMAKVPFTQIANLTGQPAMSVPLFWDQDNLPVGVQLVAPVGQDLQLLQLARQLEEAQPWFDRVPGI